MVLRPETLLKGFLKPCKNKQADEMVKSLTSIYKCISLWNSGGWRSAEVSTSYGPVRRFDLYF